MTPWGVVGKSPGCEFDYSGTGYDLQRRQQCVKSPQRISEFPPFPKKGPNPFMLVSQSSHNHVVRA